MERLETCKVFSVSLDPEDCQVSKIVLRSKGGAKIRLVTPNPKHGFEVGQEYEMTLSLVDKDNK